MTRPLCMKFDLLAVEVLALLPGGAASDSECQVSTNRSPLSERFQRSNSRFIGRPRQIADHPLRSLARRTGVGSGICERILRLVDRNSGCLEIDSKIAMVQVGARCSRLVRNGIVMASRQRPAHIRPGFSRLVTHCWHVICAN